jgi:putative ABC transport system ATP-binding protein
MTIIMVTHELDIAHYCQRTVVMRDGRIVKDEPVQTRLSAPEELRKLDLEHQAVALTS